MKNNKGFISMSLVYSFLLVFVGISIALLSIYTENISDIRRLNNEIKNDLIERGNDQIIVLENLIEDGSFEAMGDQEVTHYWSNTGNCTFSSRSDSSQGNTNVQTGQAYYGSGSIEIRTEGLACQFTSQVGIHMYKDHVYYVEILHNSGDGYGDKFPDQAFTNIYFVNSESANPTSNDIITSATNIRAPKPFGVGWTMPSGTGAAFDMGTVNADIFRFKKNDGVYNIGIQFTDTTEEQPMYMDGFMLIDITAAIGIEKASKLCDNTTYNAGANAPEACTNNATVAPQIWRLKAKKMQTQEGNIVYGNDGFYDGRKVFSAHDPDSIK